MSNMKTPKRWLEYADLFRRGFGICAIARIYHVYEITVEAAIRHFVKAGGR